MISLQVNGLAQTQARLKTAAAEMPAVGERSVRLMSLFAHQALVKRMSVVGATDSFWGRLSPPGDVLGRRSSMTIRRLSPGGVVVKRGTGWQSVVGSPDEHVAFLEEGGALRGTSPKGYLRIPTRGAQTAAGVDRWTGMSAKNIPGSFILKSKAGNLWIALQDKGKWPILLYLLKKVVQQRGRHIFRDATAETNRQAPVIGNAQVSALVRKANG